MLLLATPCVCVCVCVCVQLLQSTVPVQSSPVQRLYTAKINGGPTTAEGTCALSTEESVMEPFVISVDTTVPQGSVTIWQSIIVNMEPTMYKIHTLI